MTKFHHHPDIRQASTPDKAIYLDAHLFAQMREKVFAASWQWIGDTDALRAPDSLMPVTMLPGWLDEPLLFTRDREGRLAGMSNVCTHRGNILVPQACRASRIVCAYHGRRFDLDGSFAFMPEFSEVRNFPSAADDLTRVPWHTWGKWLFAALRPARPAGELLKPMTDRLAWLPVDDFAYRPDLSRDYILEANWALYCENYLEGFHIPFVHAGLNAAIDYGTYTTELFAGGSLQLALAKDDELAFDLPASSPDFGKRVGAYYFWIYPNMMFNFYPWGLSLNVVKPVSVGKTVISFYTYLWNESAYDKGAGAGLDQVEMEDEAIVLAVQQGIRSRYYQHGRYSATRETGTHHFHQLLTSALV